VDEFSDRPDAVREGAEVRVCPLEDDGRIPNHPDFPLLLYLDVLDLSGDDPAATVESVYGANGWEGTWRNGIFSYHHYHSTAHEVLGMAAGKAEVQFGGASGMVGGYPPGQECDLLRGRAGDRPAADRNIASVPVPDRDPIYGRDGPMQKHWARDGSGSS